LNNPPLLSLTTKEADSKIFECLWKLKKGDIKGKAFAESTIRAVGKRLRILSRHTDLNNPEQVKDYIASLQSGNGYKESLAEAYDYFVTCHGLHWEKPYYERYDKLPKIPKEEKLNMLIANAGRKYALILSMMKDLGTRPIELTWLKVKDIDLERGTVNITTAKYGKGRTLKLKENTLAMLKTYISEHKLSLNDRLFPIKSESLGESYRRLRNKLAEKLGDLTFKTIRLYDFRHWKATITYHRTKDLLYVKSMLGHKNIRSTLRYTQLIDFGNEEFTCKVAKNLQEATKLIEAGFEYVTDVDEVKIFRKRK
jgi:integrase